VNEEERSKTQEASSKILILLVLLLDTINLDTVKERHKIMEKLHVKGMNNIFRLNPGDLHVYSLRFCMENATPAGVEHLVIHRFYKHLMPLASNTMGNVKRNNVVKNITILK
jgi:hypothetical protein